MADSDSGQLLSRIARLCFLARTKQGMKIDPAKFMQDPKYAMQVLADVQNHDVVDEELLSLSMNLSLMLGNTKPNKTEEPEPEKPKSSKDYKFGPRG